jgi:hypothetical protein
LAARYCKVVLSGILLAGVAVACASSDDATSSGRSVTASAVESPIAAATSIGDLGGIPTGGAGFPDSLRHLVEGYRVAIVATPISARQWVPTPGAIPRTVYDLQVQAVISGADVATADHVDLVLTGGTLEDGNVISVEEPPDIGKRYLFLLADDRAFRFEGLSAPGYTRFQISDDDHIIPNGHEAGAGIRAISGITEAQYNAAAASASPQDALRKLRGQSLDAAIAAIKAAFAEGPVPSYPSWWINSVPPAPTTLIPLTTPTPTASPTVTPAKTPMPSVIETAIAPKP